MMGMLGLLTLLMLLKGSSSSSSVDVQAIRAQAEAERRRRRAAQTNNASDHAAAEQADKHAQEVIKATSTPPPWPQAIPPDLPAFPSGWQADEPPGPGVVARATQLLPQLWQFGAGTRKTEKTGERWITYVATPMGAKKGVVAYRPRANAPPQMTPLPRVAPVPVQPAPAPASPNFGIPDDRIVSTSSPVGLPTLRQGSRGAEVAIVQGKLGIKADGIFGPGTAAAVRAFQASRGLTNDGIVGPQTWGALMGKAA